MGLIAKQSGCGNWHPRRRGFTIAELLVASVVTSMTFVAVYYIFFQAIRAEATVALRWKERHAAEAIVSHITETLEQAVNIPGIVTIHGGANGSEGESFLKCTVGGKALAGSDVSRMSVSRVRYSWNFQDTEGEDTKSILLQKLRYAGASVVTPIAEQEEMNEDELWEKAPSTTIGTQLDGVSVSYKNTKEPGASWGDSWKDSAGDVAVRIRVNVGGEMVERIVVPQANSPVIAK